MSARNKSDPGTAPRLNQERLLDVREAAALLSVKPATLYQWAYQRRVPVVKLLGRALRFRLTDLEQLIADSERPALRAAPGIGDRDGGGVV